MEEREKLVQKWLNNELTETELKSFMTKDDFAAFQKIDQAAQHFKAPEFDSNSSFTSILENKSTSSISRFSLTRYIGTIAAILVIAFGLFQFLGNLSLVNYDTAIGEQEKILLPDSSKMILNASSTASFNKNDWDRNIQLEGEAYFKVAKGETFSVLTDQGVVKVLGTQFTVKDRLNLFEVTCFEGLVVVMYNNKKYKLPLGTRLTIKNNTVLQESTADIEPSWIRGVSIFKSTSLAQVLKELKRQYNIELVLNDVDQSILFTGSFTHKSLEAALQSIAIPLTLDYQINNNKVTLTKQ